MGHARTRRRHVVRRTRQQQDRPDRRHGVGSPRSPLPTPDSVPQALVFDRRGRLWYTASEANKLGRIDRNGTITEFDVPTPTALPLGMTLGPDNALWFTERSADQIGRFDLALETFTEYALPAGANPQRIVLGHDGALWFTEFSPSKIGRITPGGELTEYPTPSQPVGIVADRHGLWYAGYNAARIGHLSYGGVPTVEYQVPTPNSRPIQLALAHGAEPRPLVHRERRKPNRPPTAPRSLTHSRAGSGRESRAAEHQRPSPCSRRPPTPACCPGSSPTTAPDRSDPVGGGCGGRQCLVTKR